MLALLIAASVLAATTRSFAQNVPFGQAVPVPKAAPKGRDASDAPRGPSTTGATAMTPPSPVIPDPHRNVPANIFATFDANQKAQAAKVSAYLSSLQTLVGNFVQVGPMAPKPRAISIFRSPARCASNTTRRLGSISSPTVRHLRCATAI